MVFFMVIMRYVGNLLVSINPRPQSLFSKLIFHLVLNLIFKVEFLQGLQHLDGAFIDSNVWMTPTKS